MVNDLLYYIQALFLSVLEILGEGFMGRWWLESCNVDLSAGGAVTTASAPFHLDFQLWWID